jgi:hypothetical protein
MQGRFRVPSDRDVDDLTANITLVMKFHAEPLYTMYCTYEAQKHKVDASIGVCFSVFSVFPLHVRVIHICSTVRQLA